MAITQKEIIGLKPKSNAYYVWDDDRTKGVGRLGVKVFSSGSKSFVFRYYRASKRIFIQLGRVPALSLTDARETAKDLGLMLKRGLDPKFELVSAERKREAERKEQESRGSIDLLFKSYTDNMKKEGKRTHQTVFSALEKEVYPFISRGTKACDVTTDDVVKILAHMIRRGAATQSNRVRSYLHAAFNYGLSHDNDPANYLEEAKFGLAFNPVSSIPKQKSAERVGERYLSYAELHQFMHDIEFDLEGVVASEVMRCLILLCIHTGGQRPYEIAASKWSAINWDNHTLHIPPEISKNKRSHLIPLTASAITILRRQRDSSQDNPFIFPHHTDFQAHVRLDSLSQAIARYRRDHPDFEYFIPRDLRRTCKTLMGELGISKSTRDRLQNHALNDVSSKHYDRYEYLSEKRNALEVWEQKLSGVEVTSENVVSFRANSR
ncbi:tyrosine-type recombinase/integrase [Vibrio tapetis]|uniref:Phage integrase family protein n=1 Tax=Vibrio tapetis subsp. tapetis TaxID=1671868 RepID=A0A2N8Z8E9_9VIBR|nr:site-specific integrase [Vibrio tapetis]SON48143.1 Phage integrase family protein [Vibrio tapetis subsp. tapetis]